MISTKTYITFVIAGSKEAKDLNISGNEINIDDEDGSPSGYLVVGAIKYSNIEGNVAKSNYTTSAQTLAGWILSAGTGTYINPNTNKNKTGL